MIARFKMLVLQQLHNLSDGELELQVHDRRSFEKFVGWGVMHSLPDATTVVLFRERFRQVGLCEARFQLFAADLKQQGRQVRGGQIMDATIVPVPRQRHHREENKDIKQGKTGSTTPTDILTGLQVGQEE